MSVCSYRSYLFLPDFLAGRNSKNRTPLTFSALFLPVPTFLPRAYARVLARLAHLPPIEFLKTGRNGRNGRNSVVLQNEFCSYLFLPFLPRGRTAA